MFYVNDKPKGKFLYTVTIKLCCFVKFKGKPLFQSDKTTVINENIVLIRLRCNLLRKIRESERARERERELSSNCYKQLTDFHPYLLGDSAKLVC